MPAYVSAGLASLLLLLAIGTLLLFGSGMDGERYS